MMPLPGACWQAICPQRAATGIELVLVGGVPVWQHGQGTAARTGQVLLRNRARAAAGPA